MPPPRGRSFPFAPRQSADWLMSHVTYDQAVDMFFNQTATQQNLGHDPLVYSKIFRGVTYATIQEAQQVFTETMNAEYEAREQRDLADENRGCKASKILNDNIRNRIVPTEDGLESLTAYRKPFGEKCVSPLSLFTKSLNKESMMHTQASDVQPQFVNPTQSAAQQAYDFTESEWNKSLQDNMREYLEKHHHLVVIYTLEDAVITLKAIWEEHGVDILIGVAALKALHKVGKSTYDASKIAKAFGDYGMTAKVFEDKRGKKRISITTKHQSMKHILANGVRVKINSNKSYAIDNPKMIQTGVSPKVRMNGYKGGFVVSFLISAAIHSKDLVLDDDYLLENWLGDIGSDLLKVLLATIAAELVLLALPTLPFIATAAVLAISYVAVEQLYNNYKIGDTIIETITGDVVKP